MPVDGQVCKIYRYFPFAYQCWMALVLIENKPLDRVDIGLFGSQAVMAQAVLRAYPIE